MATPDLTGVDLGRLSEAELEKLFRECAGMLSAPQPKQPTFSGMAPHTPLGYPVMDTGAGAVAAPHSGQPAFPTMPPPPQPTQPTYPSISGVPSPVQPGYPSMMPPSHPAQPAYPNVPCMGIAAPFQYSQPVQPASLPMPPPPIPTQPTYPNLNTGMAAPSQPAQPGLQKQCSAVNHSVAATHAVAAIEASRQRRTNRATAVQADLKEQQQRNAEVHEEIQRISKGVDVAILMDCTGSMGDYIGAMKAKCLEIYDQVPKLHPGTNIRVAFVGYRDYGREAGDGQYVVYDFVDHTEAEKMRKLISGVRACGGGNAEDVAGGLKKATELSWQASTRLLIHFCDAPCHGNKYHGGRPVNGADTYPDGDPNGLVPELLLQELVTKRVDYYFAKMTTETDQMMDIFGEVYAKANAVFDVLDCNAPADNFIPLVMKSVSASVSRRPQGAGAYAPAAQRLVGQLPAGLEYGF